MSKHIHQFQRRRIGKEKDYIIYACVLPSCFTYYPEEVIVGKESRCNRCKENVFVIRKNTSGKIPHKPHCKECTYEPRNPQLRSRKQQPVVKAPKVVNLDLAKLLLED